jgi:hypothetical protein
VAHGEDQFVLAWYFDLTADQHIDAAPEDHLGFELGADHADNLSEQESARLGVKQPESVERSDRTLVELTGTAAITLPIDGVIHKLKLPCNILDIPPVESTRQEEPFCCLEVACT